MKLYKSVVFYGVILSTTFLACNRDAKKADTDKAINVKGLYSFGPDMKSLTLCEDGREYWVTDSVKDLELQYSKQNFEKPYEPVYVELEGFFVKSDSLIASLDYDSTLVVTKVVKLSKQIPDGPCAQ
ncbi:hypothetical protein EZJ43_00550 [Pedobacter changchengzhani]|uniref:NlpE C-terminal OB domain-containing protein n=1 Tax=Pedobacter changchengzhani TaxID=2529274 RepID=A0A4R5MPB1_9SPHI|nr:hypothetical protein [Pedobacter changchengzhani]TDG37621.1 hypothetical protein EZJ43_00550 [Pedobacter changchengzhani]